MKTSFNQTCTEYESLNRSIFRCIFEKVSENGRRHVLDIKTTDKSNNIAVTKTIFGGVTVRSDSSNNVGRILWRKGKTLGVIDGLEYHINSLDECVVS